MHPDSVKADDPTFYIPKSYTTNLKVFLGWVAQLKALATQEGKASQTKLVNLLTKAETDQAILPCSPEIYQAGWQAKELERAAVSPDFPAMIKFTAHDPQHGWMSNLSEHDVSDVGQNRCVDGLYHWLRFWKYPAIRKELVRQMWPEDVEKVAKKYRHLLGPPDAAKDVEFMRQCLRQKLNDHPYLVKRLLATGDKLLVADCTAQPTGDALFWGMQALNGQWIGENWLGRIWMELRAKKPRFDQRKINAQRSRIANSDPSKRLRLYGKNKGNTKSNDANAKRTYKTDTDLWTAMRRLITKRRPLKINVTSNGRVDEFNCQDLSPMRMHKVECYTDASGKKVTAVSPEVAWQYAKVYSKIIGEDGKEIDLAGKYFTDDKAGKMFPTKAWFDWRDAAYTNPRFDSNHPDFESNKDKIRRAFPKHSTVAFWYWAGEVITDRAEARKRIYVPIYKSQVEKNPAFNQLKKVFAGQGDEPGRDLLIFDYDGYDWIGLGMEPEDCLKDEHSFGHGMVIAFLLLGIDTDKIVIERKPILSVAVDAKPLLDWGTYYDSYAHFNPLKQPKMSREEKIRLEHLAVKILGIKPDEVKEEWGVGHPPGRYAQAVVRVSAAKTNRSCPDVKEIGLKIYKTTPDGRSASIPMIDFHTNTRHLLSGQSHNEHIQRTFEAGGMRGEDGIIYHYIIQEWIDGETIEDLLEGKLIQGVPLTICQADVLKIVDDLFCKLIIPLWFAMEAWWDVRVSNYVFTPKRELFMIDSDTLGANLMEKLYFCAMSDHKNNNTQTAMLRYMHMVGSLAVKCLGATGTRHRESVLANVEDRFARYLEPVYVRSYPFSPYWRNFAQDAYQKFRSAFLHLLEPDNYPLKDPSRKLKRMTRPERKTELSENQVPSKKKPR